MGASSGRQPAPACASAAAIQSALCLGNVLGVTHCSYSAAFGLAMRPTSSAGERALAHTPTLSAGVAATRQRLSVSQQS